MNTKSCPSNWSSCSGAVFSSRSIAEAEAKELSDYDGTWDGSTKWQCFEHLCDKVHHYIIGYNTWRARCFFLSEKLVGPWRATSLPSKLDRGTKLADTFWGFLLTVQRSTWGPREVLWLVSDDLVSDNEYIQPPFGGNKQEKRKREREKKTVGEERLPRQNCLV